MCATCGCGGTGESSHHHHEGGDHHHDHDHDHPGHHHAHAHDHAHGHGHGHGHGHDEGHIHPAAAEPEMVRLEAAILGKNDRIARDNRAMFAERGIVALNFTSSPGSGKTTLLERTIRALGGSPDVAVIEGDQETERDAERIRATGVPVVQVNTGAGCHLDAAMVAAAVRRLSPKERSLLLVENVGNLVCPALFDLGEHAKVVVMSVTEGDDKPLKYPHMFRAAGVVVLSKVDLLPYVEFDVEHWIANVRRVNSKARVLSVSATRGDGMDALLEWLRGAVARCGLD